MTAGPDTEAMVALQECSQRLRNLQNSVIDINKELPEITRLLDNATKKLNLRGQADSHVEIEIANEIVVAVTEKRSLCALSKINRILQLGVLLQDDTKKGMETLKRKKLPVFPEAFLFQRCAFEKIRTDFAQNLS